MKTQYVVQIQNVATRAVFELFFIDQQRAIEAARTLTDASRRVWVIKETIADDGTTTSEVVSWIDK